MKAGVAGIAKLLADSRGQKSYKANLVTPVFGQLFSLSFPEEFEQKGFKPAPKRASEARYTKYIIRHYMKGETAKNWTQVISIVGNEGLAANNPQLSPAKVVDIDSGKHKLDCPSTYSLLLLGEVKTIDGHDAFAAVVGCGTSINEAYSEAIMAIVIKGEKDYYSVQWAERGKPSSAPIIHDRAKWMGRLNALMPISLCPIIPGEAAPYPSCPNRTPSEKL